MPAAAARFGRPSLKSAETRVRDEHIATLVSLRWLLYFSLMVSGHDRKGFTRLARERQRETTGRRACKTSRSALEDALENAGRGRRQRLWANFWSSKYFLPGRCKV